jgi:hypothetical protein
VISVRHSLLITGRVCGHTCSDLGKLCHNKCAAFPACYCARSRVRRSMSNLWQSEGVQYIPASDSVWTEYDIDRCVTFPACYCAISGWRHSLPDLWQSAGVRYIPAGVSQYNQYISDGCALPARRCARASVRISLLVLVEVRLCQCAGDSALVVVRLFLWKCTCDSALVRYQRILYRSSTVD